MCIWLLLVISVSLGFLISQGSKLFYLLIDYGSVFQNFKLKIAYKEAQKIGVSFWARREFIKTRSLPLSEAAVDINDIYDTISRHSKRMKLYDCVYCISLRVSGYTALLSALIGAFFCPVFLLLFLLIPIFTYTFTDVL